MKTAELITLLATAETGVPGRAPLPQLLPAVGAGLVLALLLVIGAYGVNPQLAADAAGGVFWTKPLLALALGGCALALLAALARPGARLGPWPWFALCPPALVWAVAAAQLMQAAPAARAALVLGSSWQSCALSIVLLALPALGLSLAVLRTLAPTRLRLAGAAAGLAAASMATLAYSLHCPELALPFIAVWYVLGIVSTTLLGAWFGPRLLAW